MLCWGMWFSENYWWQEDGWTEWSWRPFPTLVVLWFYATVNTEYSIYNLVIIVQWIYFSAENIKCFTIDQQINLLFGECYQKTKQAWLHEDVTAQGVMCDLGCHAMHGLLDAFALGCRNSSVTGLDSFPQAQWNHVSDLMPPSYYKVILPFPWPAPLVQSLVKNISLLIRELQRGASGRTID